MTTLRSTRFALAFALVAACTTGCKKSKVVDAPATVRVDADPGVRAATTHIHLQMFGGSSYANLSSTPALDVTYDVSANGTADAGVATTMTTWPLSLAVAPLGGDSQRVYRVVAEGLDASNQRTGYGQVISGFLPNRSLLTSIYLDDTCRTANPTCGATQTCTGGTCATAIVVPSTLPTTCPVGQGEFDGRCVDYSECGTTVVCGSNSSCAMQLEGFLCACDAGFVHDGTRCVAPTPTCAALTAPANGSVDHTTPGNVGDVATYSCDSGYTLTGGSTTRLCLPTGWSDTAPTCTGSTTPTFTFAIKTTTARVPYGGYNYVDVVLDRVGGFADPVDVVAVLPPDGFVSGTLTIAGTDSSGRFQVAASGALVLGTTFTLKLRATSGAIVQEATVNAIVTGQPGSLDTSFGNGGTSEWSIVYKGTAILYDVRETPNTKILVGGVSQGGLGGSSMYAARLLAMGGLDSAAFDAAGSTPGVFTVAPCGCTGRTQETHSILRQQNGFVLMVGNAGKSGGTTSDDIAIQRLHDDGTVDNVGGDMGMTFEDLGGVEAVGMATLDTMHSERVLTTGTTSGTLFVYASNNQSWPDSTFGGGDGILLAPAGGTSSYGHSIVVDGSGRILVAGRVDDDVFVLRLNADGSPDITFNSTGLVRFVRTGSQDAGYVLAQPDGKVVVAFSTDEAGGALVVARLDSVGAPDPTFGTNGIARMDSGNPVAAELLLDGRIVVAGNRGSNPTIARLLTTGAPDDTMGGANGYVSLALGSMTSITSLAVTASGFLLVGGSQQVDSGSAWTNYGLVARLWN